MQIHQIEMQIEMGEIIPPIVASIIEENKHVPGSSSQGETATQEP